MSLCVAVLCKNEADNIVRCLESVKHLADWYVIVDTGSTDGTQDIVRDYLGGDKGNYELRERKWRSFAENRSEALELARKTGCDYTLFLDADMEVCTSGPLPELTADAYRITIHDRGLTYPLILLSSNKKRFWYEGVAHCELACEDPDATVEDLPELWVIDHGGQRSIANTERAEGNRDRLLELVDAGTATPRDWFFLANTFRDLGEYQPAVDAYLHRVQMEEGDPEEAYVSLWQAGNLVCRNFGVGQGLPMLLDAWLMRPTRAEALRLLSVYAAEQADRTPVPAEDSMLVLPSSYGAQPDASVGVDPEDVCAIIISRGDVPLQEIRDTLPYGDLIVVLPGGAGRESDDVRIRHDEDLKVYGRYAAIKYTDKPVVYFQDDDLLFTEHAALCAAYEPGKLISNMDAQWIADCGYHDLALVGSGSLIDRDLPFKALDAYREAYPDDDRFLLDCDFAHGVLTPFKRVDLGVEILECASADNRLWRTEGQLEGKWRTINRARALRDRILKADMREKVGAEPFSP